MKTNNETDLLQFRDILNLIRRYQLLGFTVVFASCAIAYFLAITMPKSYQSKAVFLIKAQYFNIPQISDFIPFIYTAEIRSQRNRLIRKAIDKEFISNLGEKYKLFSFPKETKGREVEETELIRALRVLQIDPSTFEVKIKHKDGKIAYSIISDCIDRVRETLIANRIGILNNYKGEIQGRLEEMRRGGDEDEKSVINIDQKLKMMANNLKAKDTKLKMLKLKYSARHPLVLNLMSKIKQLKGQIKLIQEQQELREKKGDDSSSFETFDIIYQELVHRLELINISLVLEKKGHSAYFDVIEKPFVPHKHIFPSKRKFLIMGLGASLLILILIILIREYLLITSTSASMVAAQLRIPFLGSIPRSKRIKVKQGQLY